MRLTLADRFYIGLVGVSVEALVPAPGVVVLEINSQAGPGVGTVLLGVQVELLLLHRAPQPFDHGVVH
jgi:hypothetical protein